jgi:hypothetical protein
MEIDALEKELDEQIKTMQLSIFAELKKINAPAGEKFNQHICTYKPSELDFLQRLQYAHVDNKINYKDFESWWTELHNGKVCENSRIYMSRPPPHFFM